MTRHVSRLVLAAMFAAQVASVADAREILLRCDESMGRGYIAVPTFYRVDFDNSTVTAVGIPGVPNRRYNATIMPEWIEWRNQGGIAHQINRLEGRVSWIGRDGNNWSGPCAEQLGPRL